MVFQIFYSKEYISNKKSIIILISLAYTFFGIGTSFILFKEFNQSVISLALISLMLLTTFKDLFIDQISISKSIGIKHILVDFRNKFIIFSNIFIGIFAGFSFFSLMLPSYAAEFFFNSQFGFMITTSAKDLFSNLVISDIIINNLGVLLVSLVTSFLFGIGTVFLFIVVWNASLLGVIFGEVAKHTSLIESKSIIIIFLVILFASILHIITEISSYLIVGIIGDKFSISIINKDSNLFNTVNIIIIFLIISIFLLIISAFIEVYLPNFLINFLI